MTKNDGGTAFPSHVTTNTNGVDVVSWQKGMSLRDYFAAKAMVAIIADVTKHSPGGFPTTESGRNETECCYSTVAEDAYTMADAMLAARDVKP